MAGVSHDGRHQDELHRHIERQPEGCVAVRAVFQPEDERRTQPKSMQQRMMRGVAFVQHIEELRDGIARKGARPEGQPCGNPAQQEENEHHAPIAQQLAEQGLLLRRRNTIQARQRRLIQQQARRAERCRVQHDLQQHRDRRAKARRQNGLQRLHALAEDGEQREHRADDPRRADQPFVLAEDGIAKEQRERADQHEAKALAGK